MRRIGGLSLAQDLLRFLDQVAQPHRHAYTDIANHQFSHGIWHDGMGVPYQTPCRLQHPPQPRGPPGSPAACRPRFGLDVSEHERSHLLRHGHGHLLLGLQ